MSRAGVAALSVGVALLLPFPGPHVDGWLPLGRVALSRQALDAPAGFWLVFGCVWTVYTLISFGVLSVAAAIVKKTR